MFWILFLAHFIADYPLQPTSLVQAKRHWKGLTVHVSIHFVVMVALTFSAWAALWPYLLALTVIHFGIDTFKNFLAKTKPAWVVGPYLFDQLLHFISILFIAWLIEGNLPPEALPVAQPWVIYLTGYLLATHVWAITERILNYQNKAYQTELAAHFWQRMIGRAVFLSLFLLILTPVFGPTRLAAVGAVPYFSGPFHWRALMIDLAVAFITALFVIGALGIL